MKFKFITLLIVFVCFQAIGQQTPNNLFVDSIKKIVVNEIIPQISSKETFLNGLNANQINSLDIKIIPCYEISRTALTFKKEDNIVRYLSLLKENACIVLYNNNLLPNPVFLEIFKEENVWKYNVKGLSVLKLLNLCEINTFKISSIDAYWFYKNDSLFVYSHYFKRTVSADDFFSRQYNVDCVLFAAKSTAYRHKFIDKLESERIDDSLCKAINSRQVIQDSLERIKKGSR